jgi:hypothetical protein
MLLKKNTITVVLLFIGTISYAQIVNLDTTSHWKKSFKGALNLNQAAFSSNWTGGGVNSSGFNASINYKANYQNGKNSWDNSIDLLYGFVNNDGQGFRKTIDRIYLDTKYGHQLSDKWSLYVSMNILTQFDVGYKYEKDVNGVEQPILISNFLAPGFITNAWGFEYKPVDYFFVRLSPFAPRLTIVRDSELYTAVDPLTPYGVEIGETTRFEWLAFQLVSEFDKDIAKNINLKMRYVMFANYETLELKTIDHRFEAMFTAKVNKFINVNLGGIMLYDYDQDSGAQFTQVFSLGFTYSIQNFEPEE